MRSVFAKNSIFTLLSPIINSLPINNFLPMNLKYIVSLFFVCTSVYAQVVNLFIDKLDIIEHSEAYGDEVFVHILESSGEAVSDNYFPDYPFYFRDGHLENFDRTKVWSKELNDNDQVVLFISLIEKDAPPWNIDDLVGELTLTLEKQNGQVSTRWEMADPEELDKFIIKNDKEVDLELFNDNGRYRLDLSLETV